MGFDEAGGLLMRWDSSFRCGVSGGGHYSLQKSRGIPQTSSRSGGGGGGSSNGLLLDHPRTSSISYNLHPGRLHRLHHLGPFLTGLYHLLTESLLPRLPLLLRLVLDVLGNLTFFRLLFLFLDLAIFVFVFLLRLEVDIQLLLVFVLEALFSGPSDGLIPLL